MNDLKIRNLYDSLDKSNIKVIEIPFFKEKKAVSFIHNGEFLVGLNRNLINSEVEEFCILAEEKAHYEVGIIPNDYTSNSYCERITRDKNEFRAKKYAVKNLIPKENLLTTIKKSPYICIADLAELFDVTPQFMREALKIYEII